MSPGLLTPAAQARAKINDAALQGGALVVREFINGHIQTHDGLFESMLHWQPPWRSNTSQSRVTTLLRFCCMLLVVYVGSPKKTGCTATVTVRKRPQKLRLRGPLLAVLHTSCAGTSSVRSQSIGFGKDLKALDFRTAAPDVWNSRRRKKVAL